MWPRIPIARPDIGEAERILVSRAVESGWISSKGPYVQQFEKEFAEYIGTQHGIATNSGTSALHLALAALDVGHQSEVVVPSLTFVATANCARYLGAKTVFADSHPAYWCVDPRDIERKISKKTGAIMVVHLYGHPCDMDPIMEIAKKRRIPIIEDSAEAHGAEYKSRRVGSFGEIGCFSFYGNKIITTGEGGMCVTNDLKLAEKMRMLRQHGTDPQRPYWHNIVGFSYGMTNLQAAVGLAQLRRIGQLVETKRRIAGKYGKWLQESSEITHPPEMVWAKSVYWMYSILLKNERTRNDVMNSLHHKGIETRPFFHPIHKLPPYRTRNRCPVAESLSMRGVNLPSGPCITDHELRSVCSTVREALPR